MTLEEIDTRIAHQRARLAGRPDARVECPPSPNGLHDYNGNFYQSSSGRRLCKWCRQVTDAPFESLGISER